MTSRCAEAETLSAAGLSLLSGDETGRPGECSNESLLPQKLNYKMPPTIACCCVPPPPSQLHSEPETRISCASARRLPMNFCYRLPRISYAVWRSGPRHLRGDIPVPGIREQSSRATLPHNRWRSLGIRSTSLRSPPPQTVRIPMEVPSRQHRCK